MKTILSRINLIIPLCALLCCLCACAPPPENDTESASLPVEPLPSAEPHGESALPDEEPPVSLTKETYLLLEGTDMELEAVALTTGVDGPVIYVVGGIHGDETAGYTAAELLKDIGISKGSLYILSPANKRGAEANERLCYDGEDLNRAFPGDSGGSRTDRVADAIFSDIAEKAPVLVLDLHEALIVRQNRDFLGNSFIFTSLNGIEELFFSLLEATENGDICSVPFAYFSPGIPGSINNAVANRLDIPILTVETYREDDIDIRVQNHLDVLHYILKLYEME